MQATLPSVSESQVAPGRDVGAIFAGHPLWTARYSNKNIPRSGLIPVRTSLGYPRFKLRYEIAAYLPQIAPPRALFQAKLPLEEYRPLYEAHLARTGAEALAALFARTRREHGGGGLLLLCFEDLREKGSWCHRRLFAAWYEKMTGLLVPEIPEPVL